MGLGFVNDDASRCAAMHLTAWARRLYSASSLMRQRKFMKHALIAALALGAIGSAAQAAPVIFNMSGVWQGTFNGVAFTDTAFTFLGVGDTNDIVPLGLGETMALQSASVTLDGFGTFAMLNPTEMTHSLVGGGFYFNQYTPALRNLVIVDGPLGNSLGTSIAPFIDTFEEIIGDPVPTTGGILKFKLTVGDTPITFSSQVYPDRTGAVPEPASWALMLTGFGSMGALLRRRRAHLVAVTA